MFFYSIARKNLFIFVVLPFVKSSLFVKMNKKKVAQDNTLSKKTKIVQGVHTISNGNKDANGSRIMAGNGVSEDLILRGATALSLPSPCSLNPIFEEEKLNKFFDYLKQTLSRSISKEFQVTTMPVLRLINSSRFHAHFLENNGVDSFLVFPCKGINLVTSSTSLALLPYIPWKSVFFQVPLTFP